MEPTHIIFLNGCSGSGKTTLAHSLQDVLSEPYLHLAADDLWPRLPKKITGIPGWWRSFDLDPYFSAFHRSVATFAEARIGVILEHCTTSTESLRQCVELFAHAHVTFVELTCPIDELVRRDKRRGSRTREEIATESGYFEDFRCETPYDLRIDTSLMAPVDAARAIAEVVTAARRETVFERLRQVRAPATSSSAAET